LAQWKSFGEDLSLLQIAESSIKGTMNKIKKIVTEFF
jgi:hypothetical protein